MNLPVSLPIGPAILLIVAAGIAGTLAGGLIGYRLAAGSHAIAENVELRRQANEYAQAARQLRARGMTIAQEFRVAQEKFSILTEELAHDLGTIDSHFRRHMANLESLVAAHPDWLDGGIGPDGMRVWNEAARAASPAATAAEPAAAGYGQLPAHAAGSDRSEPGGNAWLLPAISTPVPPVPVPDGPDDRGGGGL